MREETYRIFVTDCLKNIGKNTAMGVGGEYINVRYVDLINENDNDNRTAEEILVDLVDRGGIEVIFE